MSDTVSAHQTGDIHITFEGGVVTVTLDNSKRLNALPQRLWETLPRRFNQAISEGARAIILTGAGENFCAGADISEFDEVRKNTETARRYEKANEDAFAAIRNAPVPVIAKISGICFGGGFGLAAACDLRIASEDARFSVPAAKLGLAYPVTAMADIVRAIGAQNTKQLLYTAGRFSAQQMRNAGFLGEVVSATELDDHVSALAEQIVALAPLTHRATKASIAAALGDDAGAADQFGAETFLSTDYAEGRTAFREKRMPSFKGS